MIFARLPQTPRALQRLSGATLGLFPSFLPPGFKFRDLEISCHVPFLLAAFWNGSDRSTKGSIPPPSDRVRQAQVLPFVFSRGLPSPPPWCPPVMCFSSFFCVSTHRCVAVLLPQHKNTMLLTVPSPTISAEIVLPFPCWSLEPTSPRPAFPPSDRTEFWPLFSPAGAALVHSEFLWDFRRLPSPSLVIPFSWKIGLF